MFGSHADVRAEHEFEPAGDAVAVDCGDHRLVHVVQTASVIDLERLVAARLGCVGDRAAQICAGAECPLAGARHDQHPEIGIVLELLDRLALKHLQFWAHRVHPLGTVERHQGAPIRTVWLKQQRRFSHRRTPFLGGARMSQKIRATLSARASRRSERRPARVRAIPCEERR